MAVNQKITHESKEWALTVNVTTTPAECQSGAPTVVADVRLEWYETGVTYVAALSGDDIARLHRVFIGMPELFATYVAENKPTCDFARTITFVTTATPRITFAIDLERVQESAETVELRSQRRVIATLEARVAALETEITRALVDRENMAALTIAANITNRKIYPALRRLLPAIRDVNMINMISGTNYRECYMSEDGLWDDLIAAGLHIPPACEWLHQTINHMIKNFEPHLFNRIVTLAGRVADINTIKTSHGSVIGLIDSKLASMATSKLASMATSKQLLDLRAKLIELGAT